MGEPVQLQQMQLPFSSINRAMSLFPFLGKSASTAMQVQNFAIVDDARDTSDHKPISISLQYNAPTHACRIESALRTQIQLKGPILHSSLQGGSRRHTTSVRLACSH